MESPPIVGYIIPIARSELKVSKNQGRQSLRDQIQMSQQHTSTVVVGGGVILLEKGRIGDGSSCRAAGITSGLLWTETGVRARQIGLQLFKELSDELDGYHYNDEHGCLNVFTPTQWLERVKLLPLYDRLQVLYEILSAEAIRKRWPALNAPDDWTGLHDPRGGYSEADEYLASLARRVGQLGVEVYEQEQAVDFLIKQGRVAGVRTGTRLVEADAVVSTVHVWSLAL